MKLNMNESTGTLSLWPENTAEECYLRVFYESLNHLERIDVQGNIFESDFCILIYLGDDI